ncbi:MAG: metal-dependent hydrolase [Bacteroidota bacterium]|nr:metal-dependent hydrolase [Bacteroidota bacterium]MDP4229299.1 metal-dependent hydrolase [Bacteroidota bacterium]MDP4234876.1 metal-dependent hydrolase [Bacteroidota bacterium]
MPTVISHSIIGAGIASFSRFPNRGKVILGSILLAAIPDSDTIIMSLVGRGTMFDHRGIMHSILVACLTAFLAALLFRSKKWIEPSEIWKLMAFFILAAVSHPLLDGFSTGMRIGIGFFMPFEMSRYIFWISPLPLAPLGPAHLLSQRGLTLFSTEAAMLWTFGFGALLWTKRSGELYWKITAIVLGCAGVLAWVIALQR